ncbi:MAG: hypothetical protein HKO53_07960, partial [Gemmatimonadetes bacterium]|nr:hypothetical protein [Gemmatimonadota bacterium]
MLRIPIRPLLRVATLTLGMACYTATAATAQATPLSEGRPVPGSLADGDTVRYTLELPDDGFLFGEVNQVSVDVDIRLLGPDGSQLRRFGGLGRGGERFFSRLDEGGAHTIEVIQAGDGAGAFEITIHRAERLETDPKRLTDQLLSPFDGEDSPGAAVQVWRDGRTLYSKGYGMANLAYD